MADAMLAQIARVLCSSDHASAYVVYGSHSENPLWPIWKSMLVELGHDVFDQAPFDVLSAAARSGLGRHLSGMSFINLDCDIRAMSPVAPPANGLQSLALFD